MARLHSAVAPFKKKALISRLQKIKFKESLEIAGSELLA
jgi:hypothetical protein